MKPWVNPFRKLIVLDGHDLTGKTTLAKIAAWKLGGRYIEPFSSSIGSMIHFGYLKGEYGFLSRLFKHSMEKALSEAPEGPGPVVVDRHWMTVFSLIPKEFWDEWRPFPKTILCTCSSQVMAMRRVANGTFDSMKQEYDSFYLERYEILAKRFEVPILDTGKGNLPDVVDTCLRLISDENTLPGEAHSKELHGNKHRDGR
jgi:hypothetical protein